MQIKCKLENCEKVLKSDKDKPEEAFKQIIREFELHLKFRHLDQLEEYKEDLKEVQIAVNALPSWMLINRFIDLESEKTSKEFHEGYDELDSLLEPLAEFFEIPDDDELADEFGEEIEAIKELNDSDLAMDNVVEIEQIK